MHKMHYLNKVQQEIQVKHTKKYLMEAQSNYSIPLNQI